MAKFTDLKGNQVDVIVGAATAYFDGGNHREIETAPGSGVYVKVQESMEACGKAVADVMTSTKKKPKPADTTGDTGAAG